MAQPSTSEISAWREVVHQALDSKSQLGNAEVYQQPHIQSAQFQVRQELCFVKPRELFNGFQLHENGAFNQQVDAVPDVDVDSVVLDWKRPLRVNL